MVEEGRGMEEIYIYIYRGGEEGGNERKVGGDAA